MDSLIAAAARALAAGDALGALKRISLRGDPPALALHGIAMAQLGEHRRARELLRLAARGFAWAEGSLWVGQYRERKIHQVDPATGAVIRTIESNRFVTGVTWVDGELWHGTWEGDEGELRRIHPQSGAVLERLEMPRGVGVSGLECDGKDLFYCGGGPSGKVWAVRRPKS
jgi:hypothetical protein